MIKPISTHTHRHTDREMHLDLISVLRWLSAFCLTAENKHNIFS